MNTLISVGTGLSVFACSAEECLSWIIILLNILTVFYLVFCAWYKVTKAVKGIGYVWASALTVGSVAVVALHTCIFTILSAVFSALIIMAVLSVVLDKGILADVYNGEEKKVKPSGSYVIHKTDKGNYAFVLYDNKKRPVAKSQYKYNTIGEAKSAIELCRKNGYIAAIEDKTKSWIEFVNHPKFELSENGGVYNFIMSLSSDTLLIKSEDFDNYELCEKTMKTAISVVRSDKIYYAEREILAEDNQFIGEESKNAEKVDEVATTSDVENEDGISLKDSFNLAGQITRKEKITKKYIADYLKAKFGADVEINCRANYIKTGKLPLADTHYVLSGKKRTCFAFVYEVNNTVMMLLKVSAKLGNKFAKGHNTVHTSSFPKSKDSWYSIIVDDSFTSEDIKTILEETVLQIKEKLAK